MDLFIFDDKISNVLQTFEKLLNKIDLFAKLKLAIKIDEIFDSWGFQK